MKQKITKNRKPPRLAEWIIRQLSWFEDRDVILDNLREEYEYRFSEQGKLLAKLWYHLHVLRSIFPFFIFELKWRFIMFKNYLIIAYRNLKKYKIYSLINIIGLTLGIACCLFIYLYVKTEYSYDHYHKDSDRIFRVGLIWKFETGENHWTTISTPAMQTIMEYADDVEHIARIRNYSTQLIRYEDKRFYETNCIFVDPDIFKVLTIPFLVGNPETVLKRPNTIVINKRMATKYFKTSNPIGKFIRLGTRDFEITGIVDDPPQNTHLKYNFIGSLESETPEINEKWGNIIYITYLKLKKIVDWKIFETKIKHIADDAYNNLKKTGESHIYFLQPIKDIHLHSNMRREFEAPGNPLNLRILTILAGFILILTSLNFINLVTARISHRCKEVGIRKVVGARRFQLLFQFLGESFLIIIGSMIIAFVLVGLAMPLFNKLISTQFNINDLLTNSVFMMFVILSAILIIGAGFYPAFAISSLQYQNTFKGMVNRRTHPLHLRKFLVIGQFSIAIIMIICTCIIFNQISFMRNQNLGFSKEHKLIIHIRGAASINQNYEIIKAELRTFPSITGVCVSSAVPGRFYNITGIRLLELQNEYRFNYGYVDFDFLSEYKIELLAGQTFQRLKKADLNSIIINETALKKFGLTSPEEAIGKKINRKFSGNEYANIIGVMKDIHVYGLQTKVEPLFFTVRPFYRFITLTVGASYLDDTIEFINKKWIDFFPDIPFEYFFLDEDFNKQYAAEKQIAKMFGIFSFLSLFIACLGLFSLVTYTIMERTKEIAIRKVIGAPTYKLMILLAGMFLTWVMIANMIAWPIAYLGMKNWLQNFAYRVSLNVWIFILSGLTILIISLLTVSYQSIKAAVVNPVHSLRHE